MVDSAAALTTKPPLLEVRDFKVSYPGPLNWRSGWGFSVFTARRETGACRRIGLWEKYLGTGGDAVAANRIAGGGEGAV